MNKRVGVITMHRVPNCGSALQAYALQRVIQGMGRHCELIDYRWPSKTARNRAGEGRRTLPLFALYFNALRRRQQKLLDDFYTRYFVLSQESYADAEALRARPPAYDVYITGSDQTWNVGNLKDDTSFLLSFAPEGARKAAYAASFAGHDVPEPYRDLYKKYLARYDAVSVREASGVRTVAALAGIPAEQVLDPTLLLDADTWSALAEKSEIAAREPYVLVYALGYAFNPYPYMTELIKRLRKYCGMRLVLLSYSIKQSAFMGPRGVTNLRGVVSPLDFLKLYKNAAFVVTNSFHGTAFALNFSRPFYTVINDEPDGDDRITSLLDMTGSRERGILKNSALTGFKMDMDYTDIQTKIAALRTSSMRFLEKNI